MTIVLIAGVTILLSLLMMLAWVVQRRFGNAGVGRCGVELRSRLGRRDLCPDAGARHILARPRQILVATWSIRLGFHLLQRTRHGPEDVSLRRSGPAWRTGSRAVMS
jgi:steroid 5-alpha reductase family enzyme